MRKELSRMGSVIGDSASYDYSALSLAATRPTLSRSWEIFTDVALRPSFTKRGCSAGAGAHRRQLRDDADQPVRICSVCRNASLMLVILILIGLRVRREYQSFDRRRPARISQRIMQTSRCLVSSAISIRRC